MSHNTVYGGIGKFRERFTVTDPRTGHSFTILAGRYGSSGKLDPRIVRLDFNPNKFLVTHPWLRGVIDWLGLHSKYVTLVRFDVALDMPYTRKTFLLFRDKRKREFEASYLNAASMTEYLGRRNAAGRFKLYDKTEESGLDYPLTRAELTCDGSWSATDVLEHFPHVLRLSADSKRLDAVSSSVSDIDLVVVKLLLVNPSHGYLLDTLNWRRKKTLQSILDQCSEESSSIVRDYAEKMVFEFMTRLESFVSSLHDFGCSVSQKRVVVKGDSGE